MAERLNVESCTPDWWVQLPDGSVQVLGQGKYLWKDSRLVMSRNVLIGGGAMFGRR